MATAAKNLPAETKAKEPTIWDRLEELKPEFAKTLPKHIEADAFARIVRTAIQLNPDLATCSPRSLFAACMKAASDGLILDGREAALVIRKVKIAKDPDRWERQAIYQPMVQGLMKLARNSGAVASLIAHVVYENDSFEYVLGDDERIEHKPAPFTKDRGKPIAVYAIAKMKDGTVVREVMRGADVLRIGNQGQNAYQYDPAKGANFAEWWRKTAIRRITKYMPRSSDDIGRLHEAAERLDDDFDWSESAPSDVRPAQPTKVRGAAAAKLKDVTPKAAAVQQPAEAQAEPEQADDGDAYDYDHETGEVHDYAPTAEDVI